MGVFKLSTDLLKSDLLKPDLGHAHFITRFSSSAFAVQAYLRPSPFAVKNMGHTPTPRILSSGVRNHKKTRLTKVRRVLVPDGFFKA